MSQRLVPDLRHTQAPSSSNKKVGENEKYRCLTAKLHYRLMMGRLRRMRFTSSRRKREKRFFRSQAAFLPEILTVFSELPVMPKRPQIRKCHASKTSISPHISNALPAAVNSRAKARWRVIAFWPVGRSRTEGVHCFPTTRNAKIAKIVRYHSGGFPRR